MAICLFQPWASAVVLGAKRFETRGWTTKHRGLLAIHAAITSTNMWEILRQGGRAAEVWRAILRVGPNDSLEAAFSKLPRGRVLATCELMDVVEAPTVRAVAIKHQNERGETWRESDVGDFSPGRWAWELANIRAFAAPFTIRGQQGLFSVDLPERPAQPQPQPETPAADAAQEPANG